MIWGDPNLNSALPDAIPVVTVRARYLGPDFRPLSGTVTFSAPALLTFPDSDVFLAGPVVATLDETGRISVRLPATDAPGMNPSGWAYIVKENLSGVVGSRTYALLLPKAFPEVDLADQAPADPATPNYVPVVGPVGPPGSVDSVNGKHGPAVTLGPTDVNALPIFGGALTGNLVLTGAAGTYRSITVQTGDKSRWVSQVTSGAEDGGDKGSDFELVSWTDAGTYKATLLHGRRETGSLGVGTGVPTPGARLTVNGATSLVNAASVPATANGAVILYAQNGELKVRQGDGAILPVGRGIADGSLVTGQYGGQYRDGASGLWRWDGTTWRLMGEWRAYTPTWAGLSAMGASTFGGRYNQVGKRVEMVAWLNWGTGSSLGTGSITVTLPVPAADPGTGVWGWQGTGRYVDSANPWKALYPALDKAGTTVTVHAARPSDGGWFSPGALSYLWGQTGANMRIQLTYEAA